MRPMDDGTWLVMLPGSRAETLTGATARTKMQTDETMRCLLHELKAQAYMELDMLIDAIRGFNDSTQYLHSFSRKSGMLLC